jgi:DsbC/DsbD-like thiol-disulfide interchange protein
VLSGFAKQHAIQFPLLSDKGSALIKKLGILNTLIKPEEAEYFGIPYPGSYLVDEDGRVVEKFFNREYQVRETSATALRSGFKAPVDPRSFALAEAWGEGVRLSASLSATELRFMQRADLYVTFDLAPGVHIYGQSVPDGYVATELTVTGTEGLRVGKPVFPATKPFRIKGLQEEFQVLDGKVVICAPLVIAIRDVKAVVIQVKVRYQACNDLECFLPKTETFHLEVPFGQMVR